MKKQVIVISLGGSMIVPDKINIAYLKKFRKIIKANSKKYKFIIVCGGGSIARTYISALQNIQSSTLLQNFAGISATRMNARYVSYFFNQNPQKGIPHTMKEVEQYLKKQDIVFCGALEYKSQQTSDSTAATIAKKFKAKFINLTNIDGLYDKNPKTSKNAKFISKITWKDFYKKANKLKFKPGQHFVLDQTAAEIILKNKIPTYILGPTLTNLDKLLKNKSFKGTIIQN